MGRARFGFVGAKRVLSQLLLAALVLTVMVDRGLIAHASGSVQLLSSSSWTDSIGNIHIVGEVLNNTGAYHDFIQINFEYLDASGRLLKPDFTFTDANELAPGERGGFTNIFTPPAGYDHYSITGIGESTTSSPPNHNFSTLVTNVFTDSIGAQHVVGTVTNNNSTTDTFVEVLFTVYGCDGTTVDSDFTFVQAPDGSSTLAPGQTAPFELIRLSDSPAMTAMRLITQSSDAPSPYVLRPATINPVPPAASNVNATPGVASATVTWSPPACSAAYSINGFTVTPYVGSTAQTSVAAGPASTSVKVQNLTNGTTYTFTVTANNNAGAGAASSPSNPVTPADVPGPPTSVNATAGNTTANVSWGPPASDGGSPLTGYAVSSSPGSIGVSVGSSTTSTAITGLSNGTTYTFTVRATNAIGSGSASLPSNAVTPIGPPAAPSKVAAIAGEASATVSWTAGDSNGSPVGSYTVTSTPGSLSVTVGGAAHSAVVSGLSDGIAYSFVVTATNAVGTGAPSVPSNSVVPGRGQYYALPPARILDTRSGLGAPAGRVGPGGKLDVQITGQGGVPSSGVAAVILNVTVTNTTNPSYLTIWPAGVPQPVASNLNWTAGKTVPNLVEVAVGLDGKISVFNAAGSTDVIFDVAGYVATPVSSPAPNGLYTPVVPKRVLDTRDGTGGVPVGAVGEGGVVTVRVNGQAGLPASGVAAVVLNVTVTGATAPSYLTVWPAGVAQPVASNLNYVAGQTVPNRVIVQVGSHGTPGWVSFYNAAGSTQVIADIGGWFSDGTDAGAG